MGDEISISANETTIYDILSRSHCFDVPNYQRQYSWMEEQWTDLWNDLLDLREGDTHFLGSFVVISGSYEPTETNTLQLVDGQQRLTTVTILLCALRQRYREVGNDESAELIDKKFLWETDFERTRPRIRLGDLDQTDYGAILDGHPENVTRNPLLSECYQFFYEQTENKSEDELDELRELLLKKMSVVMIRSHSESSAFKLFETLNDRGMDLSAIDLMKNHLFQISHNSNADASEIKEQWERTIVNISRLSNPVRFFRHYLMSTPHPKITGRVTEAKVYDEFKKSISEVQSSPSMSLEDYIADLEAQSRTYIAIATAEVNEFSPGKNDVINSRLRKLDDIGGTPARTLLLRAFRESDDPNALLDTIKLVEVFMLRRSVARYTTGTEVDKLFNRLSHESFGLQEPVEHIRQEFKKKSPSNEEFKRNFAQKDHKQNSQTKYILDILEQEYFTEGSGEGKEVGKPSQVHIEHVAPQQTFSAKKYNKWAKYLATDKQTFLEYRNRIGNLTLLEKRLNLAASDNPFEQKKREYKKSEFQMTRAICEYDTWSLEVIDQRSQELADIATRIWSLES